MVKWRAAQQKGKAMADCKDAVLMALASSGLKTPFDEQWAEYWCKRGFHPDEIVAALKRIEEHMQRVRFELVCGELNDAEWKMVKKMLEAGKSTDEIYKAIYNMRKSPENTPNGSRKPLSK